MRSTSLSVSERVLSLIRKYGTKNLRQWDGYKDSLQEFGLNSDDVTDEALSAASLELHHADEKMRSGVEEFNSLFSKERKMSETNETAVATVETPKAPAKKPAKAAAKKPAKAKAGNNGSPKKIQGAQVRILRFLAKRKSPVDLKGIADGAETPYANLTVMIGSLKDDKRRENDKTFPCLLTLGYIRRVVEESDTGGDDVAYVITDKGRKALDTLPAPRSKSTTNREQKPELDDPRIPKVGTTLTRPYKGKDEKIKITKEGFVWNGVVYLSLSAVAKAICGSHCSGYVFFKDVLNPTGK